MESNRINANPTKGFFISMLTRDIDVKAAILELIDNAIDGAKRIRTSGDYNGLHINLTINADEFVIEDNCGGMSIETAREYAFRFGRSEDRPKEAGNFTGVFGIGMKRSLFRLGDWFSVESKTETDYFKLHVDVKEWLTERGTDWGFNFDDFKIDQNYPNEARGTKIKVTKLHSGIVTNFGSDYFINLFRDHLALYKTIVAENGLEIKVNDEPIVFTKEQILKSNLIKPYVKKKEVDNVKITVLAGLAIKGEPEKAGWYIYCNGRVVLSADQTAMTGWGDKENSVKKYHPSLAAFRGYVFFESIDVERLPWNTTKTSVDTSSNAYIQAKTLMIDATKQIIKFENDLDKLEENRADAEKNLFQAKDLITLNSVTINKLTKSESPFVCPTNQSDLLPGPIVVMTSIQFQVEKTRVERVKKQMFVSKNYEVGSKMFEYYWDNEIIDD